MFVRNGINYSLPISFAALVVGVLLILTGVIPFVVLGGILLFAVLMLPFLQLGIKPNPPVGRGPTSATAEPAPAPEEGARGESQAPPQRRDPAQRPGRR